MRNYAPMIQRVLALVFVLLVFTAPSSTGAQSRFRHKHTDALFPGDKTSDKHNPAIFVFHTDEFWLNLHHFLYVLGRAENQENDTARQAVAGAPADQQRGFKKLNVKEQEIWRGAVAAYAANASKKDIVFDKSMPVISRALANAGDARSLTAPEIDDSLATILQRAAPIYRKAWWKEHREANRKWRKSIQSLLDRHGAAVLAFITNAYKQEWPAAGFLVCDFWYFQTMC